MQVNPTPLRVFDEATKKTRFPKLSKIQHNHKVKTLNNILFSLKSLISLLTNLIMPHTITPGKYKWNF